MHCFVTLVLWDHQQPPLTPDERKVLKHGWGDWTSFTQSYGLKAFDPDENDEAKRILEAMVAGEKEQN